MIASDLRFLRDPPLSKAAEYAKTAVDKPCEPGKAGEWLAAEEGPDQASRYRLLETMRAYARQQLAAGELGRLQRAHAGHYAAFAATAGPWRRWRRSTLSW